MIYVRLRLAIRFCVYLRYIEYRQFAKSALQGGSLSCIWDETLNRPTGPVQRWCHVQCSCNVALDENMSRPKGPARFFVSGAESWAGPTGRLAFSHLERNLEPAQRAGSLFCIWVDILSQHNGPARFFRIWGEILGRPKGRTALRKVFKDMFSQSRVFQGGSLSFVCRKGRNMQ